MQRAPWNSFKRVARAQLAVVFLRFLKGHAPCMCISALLSLFPLPGFSTTFLPAYTFPPPNQHFFSWTPWPKSNQGWTNFPVRRVGWSASLVKGRIPCWTQAVLASAHWKNVRPSRCIPSRWDCHPACNQFLSH